MNRQNTDRLRRAIKALSKDENQEDYAILATVKSVESTTCTVQPIDGSAEISEVKLKPEEKKTAFELSPKVGSVVMITMVNQSDGFISMFSEVDIFIAQTTAGNVVQLQDGSKGGIPITADLVTQLNTIEQDLNDLKQAFTTWVPVAQDGGAALKAALSGYVSSTITPTESEDIENKKVTHGIS